MHKRIAQIERKIARIKETLVGTGEMRPGSLTYQYQKPKERKGGFYQISYTHHMKSRTEYVRREFVKDMRRQITAFKKFKNLVQEWTGLAIEHSRLKMKIEKEAGKHLS
jgi:hypothetical protein